IVAVAQARLERLEPSARRLLRAASIYGQSFSLEALTALVGDELGRLEPILEALVEREAIGPAEHPRHPRANAFLFRHVLLRSAAYAMLTERDRVVGHRLAATWLHGTGEDGEVVALHLLEGGEPFEAAARFAEAGAARWAHAQAEAAARCAV